MTYEEMMALPLGQLVEVTGECDGRDFLFDVGCVIEVDEDDGMVRLDFTELGFTWWFSCEDDASCMRINGCFTPPAKRKSGLTKFLEATS